MKNTLDSVVQRVSRWPFAKTLGCITQAIVDADLIIFASIDHAAGARQIGISIPATTVLIYGHPRAGTPALIDSPLAALDLPLRVLLREEDGQVIVAFHPVGAVLLNAGVSSALAANLEHGQRSLLDALDLGNWSC